MEIDQVFSLTEVERLACEYLNRLGPEQWCKYMKHCITAEDEYLNSLDSIPLEMDEQNMYNNLIFTSCTFRVFVEKMYPLRKYELFTYFILYFHYKSCIRSGN